MLELDDPVNTQQKLVGPLSAVERGDLCLTPVVTHFRADHQPALGFPVQACRHIVIAGLTSRITEAILIPKPFAAHTQSPRISRLIGEILNDGIPLGILSLSDGILLGSPVVLEHVMPLPEVLLENR